MPAYDYKCTTCGEIFEIRRHATDDAPVSCPECGAPAKQVFHAVGVHFKGSGFHNTDYRTSPVPSESAPACPASSGGACDGCPSAQ